MGAQRSKEPDGSPEPAAVSDAGPMAMVAAAPVHTCGHAGRRADVATIFAPRRPSAPSARAKALHAAAQESLAQQDSKPKSASSTASRPSAGGPQASASAASLPILPRKALGAAAGPLSQSQGGLPLPSSPQSPLSPQSLVSSWSPPSPKSPASPLPLQQPPGGERLRSAASAGSPPTNASSLLNRRLAGGRQRPQLQIDSTRPENQPGYRRIRWCDNFHQLYSVGGELMPSVHRDMEVRTAVRRGGDREEVVVKVRRKRGSFHGKGEEKAWRTNTEVLLNMPMGEGIAQIHEVLEDDVAYYIVMEKVGGLDLFETLQHSGRLPLEEVREVLRQLVEGVHRLHLHGCIHKDLKLENVMLDRTPSASPKYGAADFGPPCTSAAAPLRKTGQAAPARRRSTSSDATGAFPGTVKLIDFDTVEEWTPKSPKAKDVLGTDQYIAPEAYEGRYSPASDIFAVGVIAYKLLTGMFPFRCTIFDDKPGENWVGSPKMKEIKGKIEGEKLDWRHPIFTSNPGLQHLVARMLATKEQHRPSAKEVLADSWFSMQPLTSQPRRHSVSAHWMLPHCIDDEN